jgi:hypothetical protein
MSSTPSSAAASASVAHRRANALVAQLVTSPVAAAASSGGALTVQATAAGASGGALAGPDASVHYGGLLAAKALQEQGVRWAFTLTGSSCNSSFTARWRLTLDFSNWQLLT